VGIWRGKMGKPLVTGKAAKPRHFNKIKINYLTLIWLKKKKKTWITGATMEEWLNMFNSKMKKENRNAILFLTTLPATHR
jgi:hypothetical protein